MPFRTNTIIYASNAKVSPKKNGNMIAVLIALTLFNDCVNNVMGDTTVGKGTKSSRFLNFHFTVKIIQLVTVSAFLCRVLTSFFATV